MASKALIFSLFTVILVIAALEDFYKGFPKSFGDTIFMIVSGCYKILHSNAFEVSEGEDCMLVNGIRGICKRKEFCKRPKTTLFNNKTVPIESCGFTRDDDQLFCCLPSVNQANKACSRYKKGVFRKTVPFISNGRPAEKGEFPHMVALYWPDLSEDLNATPWMCGGSLISERFVLTAAHCLLNGNGPSKVRVGDNDLASSDDDKGSREYAVTQIIIHPRYNNKKSAYNDIGLVKTNETVIFDFFVYPACIKTTGRLGSTEYSISGWGATRANNVRGIGNFQPLRYATVLSMENKVCHEMYNNDYIQIFSQKFYPRGIIKSQVCAKASENEDSDTCEGDSGGPLQYLQGDLYYIVGVVSFGQTCGSENPGVYTRVSSFAAWIDVFAWQL